MAITCRKPRITVVKTAIAILSVLLRTVCTIPEKLCLFHGKKYQIYCKISFKTFKSFPFNLANKQILCEFEQLRY